MTNTQRKKIIYQLIRQNVGEQARKCEISGVRLAILLKAQNMCEDSCIFEDPLLIPNRMCWAGLTPGSLPLGIVTLRQWGLRFRTVSYISTGCICEDTYIFETQFPTDQEDMRVRCDVWSTASRQCISH